MWGWIEQHQFTHADFRRFIGKPFLHRLFCKHYGHSLLGIVDIQYLLLDFVSPFIILIHGNDATPQRNGIGLDFHFGIAFHIVLATNSIVSKRPHGKIDDGPYNASIPRCLQKFRKSTLPRLIWSQCCNYLLSLYPILHGTKCACLRNLPRSGSSWIEFVL